MKKFYFLLSLLIFSGAILFVIGTYENAIIFFGDTDLSYHFAERYFGFDKNYIWNDYFQSGSFDYFRFQGFFLKRFIFLINQAVGDLYLFSYLWFFLPYLFYLVSFYFLIKQILSFLHSNETKNWLITTVLSLFAFYNGTFIIFAGQTLFVLALILMNVFLLFFFKNLQYIEASKKNNFAYILIMAFALSESTIYIQMVILLGYAFIILLPFTFSYFYSRIKIFLIQGLAIVVLTLLLGAGWIIPLAHHVLQSDASYTSLSLYSVDLALKQAESVSSLVQMNELLRQKSYHLYNEVPFLLHIAGIAPLFIFVVEVMKRKKNQILIALLFAYLIFIFFSYGVHTNTSAVHLILWENVPFFNTFRTVMKFAFVPLYLLIFALSYIIARSSTPKKTILYLSLLVLSISFNSTIYNQGQFKRTMKQYTIPDYYFAVKDTPQVGQNDTVGNSIYLPQTNWQTQYDWAPKFIDGMNILPFFQGSGNLLNGAQYLPDNPYVFNSYFDYSFRQSAIEDLKGLLSYKNIDTIIFQNDVRFADNKEDNEKKKISLKQALSVFKSENLCAAIEEIGELYFCQIHNQFVSPVLFPSNTIITVKGQPSIDLVPIHPQIQADLYTLNISSPSATILMEDPATQFNLDKSTDVYTSNVPMVRENCIKKASACNIFILTFIPKGKYVVYFKHYPLVHIAPLKDIDFDLTFYYLTDNENQTEEKIATRTLSISDSAQDNNVLLDTLDVPNNTIFIKTPANEYFSNGRFYFVEVSEKLEAPKLPVLEFKKINSTRYQVLIHQASNDFILNLLENYHSGWRLSVREKNVISSIVPHTNKNNLKSKDRDMATIQEIKQMNSNGWISSVASFPAQYISSLIRNSIQNDNMPDTPSREGENQQYVDTHIKTFGYANGWSIRKQDICRDNTCTFHADGTYDAELEIEFTYQKTLKTGLTIAISTFLLICICLFFYKYSQIIKKLKRHFYE